MAQAIDLAELDMRRPPRPLPETADLSIAELMDESLGADALIARVGPRDEA
jgi:hypothetical protein